MNYIEQSLRLAQAGRLAEAIAEMRAQISNHPEQTYLNFWLGVLLYDMGEYEQACDAFRLELKINPRSRDAAWELGSACSKLGLAEDADKAYQLALDIDPCCAQALFGLGNAQLRKGNYAGAIEYYRDVLILLPELDRSDPRGTEKDYKSSTVAAHFNLGVALTKVNKLADARTSFEAVQTLDPGGSSAEAASRYLAWLSNPNEGPDPA